VKKSFWRLLLLKLVFLLLLVGRRSSSVIPASGRRVGVWILSWAKIDSVEGGEKSVITEKSG
jgi:hypothetical protein